MSDRITLAFPNLAIENYEVTSPLTEEYNCIAWAVGDTTRWWWPDPEEQDYWPPKVERAATLHSFEFAFKSIGFETCTGGDVEPGFTKIALFAHGDRPTHAARQLPDGSWTSKLGAWEDIMHVDLDGVAGEVYGSVAMYLRRPVS